jgi:hypothetical protein
MGTAILLRDRPHSTHLSSRDIIIHFKSDETPRSLIFPWKTLAKESTYTLGSTVNVMRRRF